MFTSYFRLHPFTKVLSLYSSQFISRQMKQISRLEHSLGVELVFGSCVTGDIASSGGHICAHGGDHHQSGG